MAEKKCIGKYTIKFNLHDPGHRQVIDLLEPMGRTKAQFLANAVLHYIHCDKTPDIPQSPPTDYAVVESIVRRILEERLGDEAPDGQSATPTQQKAAKKLRQSEEIHFENAAEFLGEDGMAAIADTLSAFRNK